MFEGMLFYIFVCLAFFAIGDFLGVATKAKVSSVFVSLLLFLIFFMADWIPDDVINQAGLTQIGKWAVGFVVFGMGTTINMRELMAEWRTVATACLSMAVIWIGMIVLVPLIGYNETIVAIPIINGFVVATQIMTSAAMENGLEMAAALGTILYAVQKFFGTPFASYFGLREAREVSAAFAQELGDLKNDEVGRQLTEMLRTVIFNVLLPKVSNEEAAVKPSDLMLMAKAIKDLSSANKLSADLELKVRKEAAEQAKQEAVKGVIAAGRKNGLSKEVLDAMKRGVFGLEE